jgi:hypothetical protein
MLCPQPFRQAIGRNRLALPKREHREDRPLLAEAQLDRAVPEANLERPWQPHVHLRATLTPVKWRVNPT